uniref:Galectin n=1 Tax=Pyxicephalus adspersus TaxID=30357 RepID=A0AAV3B2P8_PYXAD|nr:TPA: hypothetical protein GDO54_000114 [Pyxicephalus adspersus]
MLDGVVCDSIFVLPGQSVEVMGFIPPNCNHFSISLGNDFRNLLLHFDPRFDPSGINNHIICNSMKDSLWGEVHREHQFPFQKGTCTTITFTYHENRITVKMPSECSFDFPVRYFMRAIRFLSMKNLQLACLTLE